MNITPQVAEFQIGSETIRIETGVLALQASGAVVVRAGETVVLVTATVSSNLRDLDFFPLTVDYENKMYAVGRIPGSFMRREGRASDSAILSGRVIDRQIRPLFPDGFRNDVQVVALPLSMDQIYQPDMLAMIGASAALSISEIPFAGPTAAVRIGLIDDNWVINPTYPEMEESLLDLIVAGTEDSINMVEAGAKILSEEKMLEAIEFGHAEIKKIIAEIKALAAKVGKPKMEPAYFQVNEELRSYVAGQIQTPIEQAMELAEDKERKQRMQVIQTELLQHLAALPDDSAIKALYKEQPKAIGHIVYGIEKKTMRKAILEQEKRIDGRKPDVIRELHSDVGLLARTHGSGLFIRGTTQVMSLTTLGSMSDAQPLDGTDPETMKRYVHHYNFPAYSVGEVRPMRGPGRREIGHGNLAERALLPVLPDERTFPYAIRVVSEVLSSNGSTSMASTCASTLSLMDAGVPIKDMVAGVAMGLIKEGDNYKVLTDIQGVEDHLGDMDFKVTGTRDGITALQMDIKVDGLSLEILKNALEQARQGRLHILDSMQQVLSAPRTDLSPYAPRIVVMQINPNKIGDVIGPGGKMIKKIVEELGVKIDIDDDGAVFIVTPDLEASKAAQEWILSITQEVEVGTTYNGQVVRLTTFGAFIQVLPGQDGLLHISKIPGRPRRIEDVFSMGDMVKVKVTEIDSQGRLNLSLDQEVEIKASAEPAGDRERGEYRPDRDRGGDRDRDRHSSRGGVRSGGGGGYRGGGGGR